ncbi:hypothetical protein [Pseudooceanicola sp.]
MRMVCPFQLCGKATVAATATSDDLAPASPVWVNADGLHLSGPVGASS